MPSRLRLAPPSAREEAQKNATFKKNQPANKNRSGVKGWACGGQQAKQKANPHALSLGEPLQKKNLILGEGTFTDWKLQIV